MRSGNICQAHILKTMAKVKVVLKFPLVVYNKWKTTW